MPRKLTFHARACMYAVLLFAAASLAVAQDSLQFNVPYLCSDGSTYVVHKCEKGPKFEFCYYQRDQDSERYNVRASVWNQMSQCKLKSAAPAAASAPQPTSDLQLNTPYQCPGGLTLTVFQCQKQNGQDFCFVKAEQDGKFLMQVPKPRSEAATQLKACKAGTTFNPPYLAEFPNAYRVVQGMVVGNPAENVQRSIGAFYQLSEIINVLAGQRSHTPDEKKFLDDYSRIQLELAQAAAKKFPGQKFDAATNPYRFNHNDPKFGFEGIPVWVTFLSPGIQAQFAQIVGHNDPHYVAQVEQEKRAAMQKLQTDMDVAQSEAQMRKDPGTVALRKCKESGRSDMECLGEGLKVGAADLFGGNPMADVTPAEKPGLRLTGTYSSANFSLGFDQSSTTVACGTLVPQGAPYSIQRAGSQLLVNVGISPKPVVLTYKDGKLVGPGQIDVAGRVVVGGAVATSSTSYEAQTQTTTQQRQIDAGDVANYSADTVHQNGMEYSVDEPTTTTSYTPVTTHHYSVPTAPKTERCNASLLPATASNVKMSDALTQVLGSQGSKSQNTAPGLRLAGTYAAPGGLKVEFRADSATLECSEALSSEAYAVVTEGEQLVVKFQNSTGPLSLVVQPNGNLTGSGATDVAGRKMYKTSAGEIAYIPQNARCTLGTLIPSK